MEPFVYAHGKQTEHIKDLDKVDSIDAGLDSQNYVNKS